MLRLVKVLGRVPALRGIATANMAARVALAQRDPHSALRQALLTGVGGSLRRKILGS